MALGYKKKVKR